jgi:hypothetical protein
MIIEGNSAWYVSPSNRYGLSKVTSNNITNSDFTFLCRIKIDWEKMVENTYTQHSSIMIKSGKNLGIGVSKTGNNYRVIKALAWTTVLPDDINTKGVHEIHIPLNNDTTLPDISEGDIDCVFSYSVMTKTLRLNVNGIEKVLHVENPLIDYSASWLWVGCANPLENIPLEHSHYFFGEFKLMGIYQKYLTNEEIQRAFNKQLNSEHSVIAYYDFEESTPYKIMDVSSNGNHLNKYDKRWMD